MISAYEYAIILSQLNSMGVKNSKEYLDAKQKASMTSGIAKAVIGDESWNGELSGGLVNEYIADYELEYGIALDSVEDRLLVEKAITAEKARQNAELASEKVGAAEALEIAKEKGAAAAAAYINDQNALSSAEKRMALDQSQGVALTEKYKHAKEIL